MKKQLELERPFTCSSRACGAQKLGPTENLFHVTLLHQFKELRSARWKSIDSKYVRAAWSFDEAQLSQRSNQAENLTSPLFMLLGLNFCAPHGETCSIPCALGR